MKKMIMWSAIAVVLAVACGQGTLASITVSNISFGQADWYDIEDNLITANSMWGRIDLDVQGDPTDTYYLNVYASKGGYGGAWVMQNLPLFPTTIEPPSIRVGADFSISELGLTEGMSLGSMDVTYSLSTTVQTEAPTGASTPFPVDSLFYRMHSMDGVLYDPGPVGDPVGIKASAPATDVIEHNVPRVQEDAKECMVGAFARSISWLNEKYKLGSIFSAQDFYMDLRARIGVDTNLSDEDRIKEKHKYLKRLDKRAVTKIWDSGGKIGPVEGVPEYTNTDLVEWLRGELPTEDVEIAFATGTSKHMVTVAGIYKQGDKWYLKIRDDEAQTGYPNSGDKSEKRWRLGKLPDVSGNYWIRKRWWSMDFAVSESIPEPSSILALLCGLGGLAWRRRR